MNRRNLLKFLAAGAAVPVTALGDDQNITYEVDPSHPAMRPVIREVANFNALVGDKISCMTVFRDTLIFATERGTIFQMSFRDLEH